VASFPPCFLIHKKKTTNNNHPSSKKKLAIFGESRLSPPYPPSRHTHRHTHYILMPIRRLHHHEQAKNIHPFSLLLHCIFLLLAFYTFLPIPSTRAKKDEPVDDRLFLSLSGSSSCMRAVFPPTLGALPHHLTTSITQNPSTFFKYGNIIITDPTKSQSTGNNNNKMAAASPSVFGAVTIYEDTSSCVQGDRHSHSRTTSRSLLHFDDCLLITCASS
jgi:hypothetical protein